MSEENVQPNVEERSPVERQKKKITEAQKKALEKARFQRKMNAENKKKGPTKSEASETFNFSGNYLIATAVLGLGGLAAYYYLKQQKNSQEWQTNLETKLTELRGAIPVLPKTLVQKEIVVQPERPPQIIEREIVREVERKPEVVPELSFEEKKRLAYFSGAKQI